MNYKICSQCKEEKPENEFSANGKYLRSNCKECQAAKRRLFVLKNKDKVLEQNRKSYQKNKEHILLEKKKYHISNKEYILEKHRDYYKNNKELILDKVKQYRYKFPEVYRASNAKRRAKMHGVLCNVSTEDIQKLKEKFNYCCAYCGCKTDKDNPLHIDHMIPLSKGGLHVIENLLPSCRRCNSRKFTMDWSDWCSLIGFKWKN